MILASLWIYCRTMFAFFLKQHHCVGRLSLQPFTIPHSFFALLLPSSYSSFNALHLIYSLSAFAFAELYVIDLRLFFNEFWIPICLSKKGFRSISRLSSSRCFISILTAPLNCAWKLSPGGWKDLLNPIWTSSPFWQQTTSSWMLSMLFWTVSQWTSIFTSLDC